MFIYVWHLMISLVMRFLSSGQFVLSGLMISLKGLVGGIFQQIVTLITRQQQQGRERADCECLCVDTLR